MENYKEEKNVLTKLPIEAFSHLIDWIAVADIDNLLLVSKAFHQQLLRLTPIFDRYGVPHMENSVFKIVKYLKVQMTELSAKKIEIQEFKTKESQWKMLEHLANAEYKQLSNNLLERIINPGKGDADVRGILVHISDSIRMADAKFSDIIKHHLKEKMFHWQSSLIEVATEKQKLIKASKFPHDYSDIHKLLDAIKMMPPGNYFRLGRFFVGNGIQTFKSVCATLSASPAVGLAFYFYLNPQGEAGIGLKIVLLFALFLLAFVVWATIFDIDLYLFNKLKTLPYKDHEVIFLVPDQNKIYSDLCLKYKTYIDEYKSSKKVITIGDLIVMLEFFLQKFPPVADVQFANACKLFDAVEKWLNDNQSYKRGKKIQLYQDVTFWRKQTKAEQVLKELYNANDWRAKKATSKALSSKI